MLVHNWTELSEVPNELATHILVVDTERCCEWLKVKPDHERPYSRRLSYMRQAPFIDHYLSTHTFYRHKYKFSTKLMHACGFDIEIDNWDKNLQ